jgi:predicted secreted protein
LEQIFVSRNKLTVLDLRDNIALKDLSCKENQITRIDLAAIEAIRCRENQLPLSNLFTFSEMISNPLKKLLGRQEFPQQRLAVGDSVDYSAEKKFRGIATVYQVAMGLVGGTPAPPTHYTLNEGVITFHISGFYRVIMTNAAIISHPESPAVVVAPIHVLDFVPVEEIINVPATATVGASLFLTGKAVPTNATYQNKTWSIWDAGTTGAVITSGSVFKATAPGTATVSATVKDGTAIGTEYTQDFTIEVSALGIDEPPQALIEVHPNPTTGELRVVSSEYRGA